MVFVFLVIEVLRARCESDALSFGRGSAEDIHMLKSFDELFAAADAAPEPVTVVAAGGADVTVLQALHQAHERGWIKPMVTGSEPQIRQVAETIGIDLRAFSIIDAEKPARAAVQQIAEKNAQILMKGQIATPEFVKAILDDEDGLTIGRAICQMVLMEIPRDNRRFLMTDTGIMIKPKFSQKADMVMHAIETAEALGVAEPRIAMMAATEKVNEKMPETEDAAKLVEQAKRGDFGRCTVQGPLSFDLAYDALAGEKKKIEGDVVGAADAMVFADLLSANLTVKGIMYTADCKFGGILCGTSVPVVFMSRADSVETRMRSLAYALAVSRYE